MRRRIETHWTTLDHHSHMYRPHHNTVTSFLGRGTLPEKRSAKIIWGIIAAIGITAEGNMMPPAMKTEDERLPGGGNGGLQYPERDASWSWSDLEGTVGPGRGVKVDDGRRQAASSPRILKKHTVESKSERGDDLNVADQEVHGKHNKDGSSKTVVVTVNEETQNSETKRMPRILTVLTTYNELSPFVKAYRDAVQDRSDGYRPTVSFLERTWLERRNGCCERRDFCSNAHGTDWPTSLLVR